MARSAEQISANKTDDNSKWLLKPKNKTETDLVSLTGRLTKMDFDRKK